MKELIDVSHVSKRGSSLRITLPKKVQDKLSVEAENIIGLYLDDRGKIILTVIK